MERFDDVSVVASIDESPPPPRMSRRTRRALTGAVAVLVTTGALAGAAVGLADEKAEPSPAAVSESSGSFERSGLECHGKRHHAAPSSSAMRY